MSALLLFLHVSINIIQSCKCFEPLFHTWVQHTRPVLRHILEYSKIKGTPARLSSIYSNKCFTVWWGDGIDQRENCRLLPGNW